MNAFSVLKTQNWKHSIREREEAYQKTLVTGRMNVTTEPDYPKFYHPNNIT